MEEKENNRRVFSMGDKKNVYVIGHKNPDTDSICAAISYAYLKMR